MGASFLCNPASKIMLAVGDAAAAVEPRVRHIPSQSGERSHNLKGRTRRKGADGAINQWSRLVFLQCCPVLRLDTGNKSVRIKRGHRHHREYVAVVWIDHN